MKIFSSIPKAHANGMDYIQMCVKSWQQHGEVYSVNHPDEIRAIKDMFPDVHFIPTFQTQVAMTGKPLVTLDAILNEMRIYHDGQTMFLNADCWLVDNKEQVKRLFQTDRFTYLHRWNYEDLATASIYRNGIDGFLFTNFSVLDYVQATHYCLGQTYFDLYYPYAISMAGMEICTTEEPTLFHKNHKEQYSPESWVRMGDYTGLIIGKKMHKPAQVTEFLYHYLRTVTVKI